MSENKWKNTLKWLGICIAMLIFSRNTAIPLSPWLFLGAIYSGLIFICHLVSAVTTSISRRIKSYEPYSITAVLLAVLLALLSGSELEAAKHPFFAAGAVAMIILYVPFLLVMAFKVYAKGRTTDKKEETL